MKYLFLLITIILLSCSLSNRMGNKQTTGTLYRVYKIDSINSYYLVYARKADTIYKIVSKKEKKDNGEQVHIGQYYALSLHSIWNQKIMIGNINVSPSLNPHITCMNFDDSTAICLEKDSINDLFTASNLKGLDITSQHHL